MGSAGFLLIFASVNLANAKLAEKTKSKKIISYIGAGLCLGALSSLIWQTFITDPRHLFVLIGMVFLSLGIEGGFRIFTSRKLKIGK
jgi:drug/metabolite transporter (DMT)-like permease